MLRRSGFRPQIGIASSKFVAGVAAQLAAQSPIVVRDGGEKEFLGPLSIEFLPIPLPTREWLGRLGLRTLGQLAEIPPDAFAAQLGAEGTLAHRLACGMDESPLRPRRKSVVLEQRFQAEGPLESMEALLAAAERLIGRLVAQLKARRQACRQMRLRLEFDGGGSWEDTLNLKIPTDSQRDLLEALGRHLPRANLPTVVSEIHISLAGLGSEYARQELLSTATKGRQEEALRRLGDELGARFGRCPLKRIVQLDPHSRIPERRTALVDFSSSDITNR